MVPPNVHPSASASPVMYAYSCSLVTSSCASQVRPKSASHRSKTGPKSRNTMSSARRGR
jgi:hypothetical protein